MITRILLGLTGADHAGPAIQQAIDLAKRHSAIVQAVSFCNQEVFSRLDQSVDPVEALPLRTTVQQQWSHVRGYSTSQASNKATNKAQPAAAHQPSQATHEPRGE